ncbi:MAG: UDP-2,3-diacylglucosamine diphosphatase [Bacteroidales bacterium]|nr:UDP-2,3-diacylglucosamine diphosphatase [Bacteroidales bacterium]
MLFDHPIEIQGNVLFISDAHLRTPEDEDSKQRETKLIQLLESRKGQFQHLFLLGDIFDFWFEYGDVAPKGYFRLFNLLYELNESGVKIYYFTGNHDMWVQDYFTQQFDCQVFYNQQAFVLNGKRCLVGHGDGLGGKQRRYNFIKRVFGYKPNRVLYSMLHPRHAFAIARHFSARSRASHKPEVLTFKNEEEFQVQYARQILEQEHVDFFIYAHRHIPVTYPLGENSCYFNTGDWLTNFSYVVYDADAPAPTLCMGE